LLAKPLSNWYNTAMNEKRLGQVVQTARRAGGFTQQALCQKSGLSYSTLAKIERGAIKSPSIFTIQQIAATLGISLDQLMQGVPSHQTVVPKKVSKNGVHFVYFDMNGCLVRAATTRAFTRLAEKSGVPFEAIETLYWQYNNAVCRGDMSMDDLNTILATRLGIMVDWNACYLEGVEATPGMAELVIWVAENYQLGILTNAMPAQVAPMLERGILPKVTYDAVVDSSEVHALKPETKMYDIAAARAGVQPSELLLVDDDKVNLAGAAALGWHTMSFDPYHPEESIVAISTALQPAE
jgi:FMN phosphatase YigB (HAD superfamily)